jgi:hypothetical protein
MTEFRDVVEKIEDDPSGAFYNYTGRILRLSWALLWQSACDLLHQDSACHWSESLKQNYEGQ